MPYKRERNQPSPTHQTRLPQRYDRGSSQDPGAERWRERHDEPDVLKHGLHQGIERRHRDVIRQAPSAPRRPDSSARSVLVGKRPGV